MTESARADKWLWATRFFKTRALAAESCTREKVKRGGHTLKPSSSIHPGDLLEVPFPEGPGHRLISVKAVISVRVGAPEARICYEDLTAPETFERQNAWQTAKRESSKGRPTKRDRREIDKIHGFRDPRP